VAAPADFPEDVYLKAASTTPVYRIDPSRSLIQIHVYREGALAKMGHDHVVASREVRGYALLPADLARARADFYFPVAALSMDEPGLRRSAGFASEIAAEDVENTRLRMLRLLEAEKHPYARIHAVRAAGTPPDLVLDAELTLHGVTRTLNIPAKLRVEGNRFSVEGETDIRQTDYGITPFSVLGGALAVKDPLRVIFRIDGVRVGIDRLSPVSARPAASQASIRAPGMVFKDCADCPEMVVIPAGRFVMGAVPGEEEREALSDQFRHRSQPQHGVNVEPFSAGKFEVTRSQYRVFAEATGRSSDGCFVWAGAEFEKDQTKDWRNPGYAQDDPHPAACVSWDDASAYVRWLSQKTGRDYRLLTEAEWEYAARAGTATTRFWGDAGNMSCGYANGADLTTQAQVPDASNWPVANCNDRYAYTAPVGSYRANAFGLYDMLGNVGEWTQDCWNGNYSGAPTDGSAWAAGDCFLRVVRGGSWEDAPVGLRAAYRVGSPTVIRVYTRGFRVARTD
jgi:formylglycine-generating enzyme required for sulfatase activity